MVLRLSSEVYKGIITWFLTTGLIIHQAYQSEHYDTKTNYCRAIVISAIFICVTMYNSTSKKAYPSMGSAQFMTRGLSMALVCVLIFILCSRHQDARQIVSIFEKLPDLLLPVPISRVSRPFVLVFFVCCSVYIDAPLIEPVIMLIRIPTSEFTTKLPLASLTID